MNKMCSAGKMTQAHWALTVEKAVNTLAPDQAKEIFKAIGEELRKHEDNSMFATFFTCGLEKTKPNEEAV